MPKDELSHLKSEEGEGKLTGQKTKQLFRWPLQKVSRVTAIRLGGLDDQSCPNE